MRVDYNRGGTPDAGNCFSEMKSVPESANRVVSGKTPLPAQYHEITYRFHIEIHLI